MKKTIGLCLALFLVILSIACFAEGIDLSGLSLRELDSLSAQVSARMHQVQVETGTVYKQGKYTVGENFPEGFMRVSVTSRSQSDLSTAVIIEGTGIGTITHIVAVSTVFDDNFLFVFREGQTVIIAGDDIIVAPY